MDQKDVSHGRYKEAERDDPLELVGERIHGGDQELMAICIIEEYARMGMDEEQILELFRQSIYRTHQLYRQWGETRIRGLVRTVLARTGRMRVSVSFPRHLGG